MTHSNAQAKSRNHRVKTICSTELGGWRLTLRLTQTRAAALLGMSRKAYAELERGFRFDDGAPTAIDRRTELACRYLLAEHRGDLSAESHRAWMRAIGKWSA